MEIPREILVNNSIYIYRLIHRYMWIEWSSTTPYNHWFPAKTEAKRLS
jgi:hypothetical protein